MQGRQWAGGTIVTECNHRQPCPTAHRPSPPWFVVPAEYYASPRPSFSPPSCPILIWYRPSPRAPYARPLPLTQWYASSIVLRLVSPRCLQTPFILWRSLKDALAVWVVGYDSASQLGQFILLSVNWPKCYCHSSNSVQY